MENNKIVKVKNVKFGCNQQLVIIAGPCSIESKKQAKEIEVSVKKVGANMFRGGSYKLRTCPSSFQGLGDKALAILKNISIPTVSEITAISQIDDFVKNVDMIQVGTRNMFNYELLKALGKTNKPILLKRAMSATIDEWLYAAQYIINNGNKNVVLCERGIRTFSDKLRFTLDIGAVSYIKQNTSFPIIVDPSHAAGDKKYVKDLSLAAIAAGADGLIIEVSEHPEKALCDKNQAISSKDLSEIIKLSKVIRKNI